MLSGFCWVGVCERELSELGEDVSRWVSLTCLSCSESIGVGSKELFLWLALSFSLSNVLLGSGAEVSVWGAVLRDL